MIVKCSHCHQILSEKDFDAHKCDLPLKECKTIKVVYFNDESYGDKKIMNGWGIDGTLYTFEVVPRKPIPLIEPIRRNFTDKKPDDNFTESLFVILISNLCIKICYCGG